MGAWKMSQLEEVIKSVTRSVGICRDYMVGPSCLRVAVCESDLLSECAHYLGVCFTAPREASPACRISAVRDDDLFRMAARLGRTSLGINVRDYLGTSSYRVRSDSRFVVGRLIDGRDYAPLLILVDRMEKEIVILAGSPLPRGLPLARWICRIAREVALRLAEDCGHIFIHAAACALRNEGFLISGPDGSGKTTCVVALVKGGDFEYVANDKVLLGDASGEMTMIGWPQSLRLGVGMVSATSELSKATSGSRWRRRRTPPVDLLSTMIGQDVVSVWRDERKFELSPQEFVAALQTRNRCHAPTNGIFLPRLSPVARRTLVKRVSAEVATKRLRNELLSPAGGRDFNWLGLRKTNYAEATTKAEDCIKWLCERLPAWEITGGPLVGVELKAGIECALNGRD